MKSLAFATATNRISISFDEDKTSLQELTTVLKQAGYAIEDSQRRASEGGCCGGGCS